MWHWLWPASCRKAAQRHGAFDTGTTSQLVLIVVPPSTVFILWLRRAGSGRMTFRELRRSDLLDALFALEREEDINRVSRYFRCAAV